MNPQKIFVDKAGARQVIADAVAQHCWYWPDKNNLMFGKLPGTRYGRQYYLANILYNQAYLRIIGNYFLQLVQESVGHFDFQITGQEWSASPLLAGITMIAAENNLNIPAFMIKRERKSYGKLNYVEGRIDPAKPVLIVDDLCNSSGSFRHCYQVCKLEHNLQIVPHLFAVVNKYRKSEMGNKILFDRYQKNLHTLYICDGDDIVQARSRIIT